MGERDVRHTKMDARDKARAREVILLADLAPRHDVKGGAGKLLFGERVEGAPGPRVRAAELRDPSPTKRSVGAPTKGGKGQVQDR
jgi:hypothetical protein